MTKERLSAAQAKEWRTISQLLKEAHDKVSQARVSLLCDIEKGAEHFAAQAAIDQAEAALSGLAYMFAPQSEWLGGDSSDPKNFCYRPPHIAQQKGAKSHDQETS